MDEMFKAVANLGFPIVLSMYLLTRVEKKIDNLIYLVLDLINLVEDEEDEKEREVK